MLFDINSQSYQELRRLLLSEKNIIVPFLGAGISRYGSNPLPLWNQLLYKLLSEAEQSGIIGDKDSKKLENISKQIKQGKYIQATENIAKFLGKPQFQSIVKRELDITGREIPPVVGELVTIGWNVLVTTNLDKFLEESFRRTFRREITTITNARQNLLSEAVSGVLDEPFPHLLKIHGCVSDFPSWCLTKSHYESLLRDKRYINSLQNLFLRRMFFIGFGLQDDDFDFILKFKKAIYPDRKCTLFALVESSKKGTKLIKDLAKNHGFKFIFFETEKYDENDPYGGYRGVYECIHDLANSWSKQEKAIPKNLVYFPLLADDFHGREFQLEILKNKVFEERLSWIQVTGFGGQGKTSLVQYFIEEYKLSLIKQGYSFIFGCSFYKADTNVFITELEKQLFNRVVTGSIAEKVKRISARLREVKALIILDGLEAISTAKGKLPNINVMEILIASMRGPGTIIITSRILVDIPLKEAGYELVLDYFNETEADSFISHWGFDLLPLKTKKKIKELTFNHPLSLKILTGFLLDKEHRDIVEKLENINFSSIKDEADPLRANKVSRVIDCYLNNMDEKEKYFMMFFSIFIKPVTYDLFKDLFVQEISSEIRNPLKNSDLRLIILQLIDSRMLIRESNVKISCHPTIREYFYVLAKTKNINLKYYHKIFAYNLAKKARNVDVQTYQDATILISLCYHAAKAGEWSLFDYYFKDKLNKGFRLFLCNNLGAWDEFLDLIRLVFPGSNVHNKPYLNPAYYTGNLARACKHTGRVQESIEAYKVCLKYCSASYDHNTTKYINNYLTLLVWSGDIKGALKLSKVNVKALSWVTGDWEFYWQYEHIFSSLGFLFLLIGDYLTAEKYYLESDKAWNNYKGEKVKAYDYYPYYRSEILIANNKNHEKALSNIDELLSTAKLMNWPESICKAHISKSLVYRDLAKSGIQSKHYLELAENEQNQALEITTGIMLPDTELALNVEVLRLAADRYLLFGNDLNTLKEQLYLLERTKALIETCGLLLYQPEVLAFEGLYKFSIGDLNASNKIAGEVQNSIESSGALHFTVSKNCLTYIFFELLQFKYIFSEINTSSYNCLEKLVNIPLSPKTLMKHC